MIFSFIGAGTDTRFSPFAQNLRQVLESRDHSWTEVPGDAQVVFNFFPRDRPRSFRRRSSAIFVVGVCDLNVVEDMVDHCYPVLVRSLSNLLIVLDDRGRLLPDAHFLTLERGHYVVESQDDAETLPTERLEAELCQLAAHISAAKCRWLLLVAEYDRRGAWASWECRNCAHWLSLKTGLGLHAARQHVSVARRLRHRSRLTTAASVRTATCTCFHDRQRRCLASTCADSKPELGQR